MMYLKLAFIGLLTLVCSNRSWYLRFQYPLLKGEHYTKSVQSGDSVVFEITTGSKYSYQCEVNHFDFKITPDNEFNDSVYFLFHTPGVNPLTNDYIPTKGNHKVLVPIGSTFRYYDYFIDSSYWYGAITGLPTVVELEPGTATRKFKIELMEVSGGHKVKDGKPPIYLTVVE